MNHFFFFFSTAPLGCKFIHLLFCDTKQKPKFCILLVSKPPLDSPLVTEQLIATWELIGLFWGIAQCANILAP